MRATTSSATTSLGPARNPAGAAFAHDVVQLAARADVVVLSLPDGGVSERVAGEVAGAPERRVTAVVDTSTIGVAAARGIDGLLSEAGVGYVDAPVSGGVAGARARTLSVMYAGPGRSLPDGRAGAGRA